MGENPPIQPAVSPASAQPCEVCPCHPKECLAQPGIQGLEVQNIPSLLAAGWDPTAWGKRGFGTAPGIEKEVDGEKIKSLSKLLFNLKKDKPGQSQRRALTLQKAHTLQSPCPEQHTASHRLEQALPPCCAQKARSAPSPAAPSLADPSAGWAGAGGSHPSSPELHSQPCSPPLLSPNSS